jgi:hypothetical protein
MASAKWSEAALAVLVSVGSSSAGCASAPSADSDATDSSLGRCVDDGNPCTSEVRVGKVCTHPPRADGTSCTGGTCINGACAAVHPTEPGAGDAASIAPDAGSDAASDAPPESSPANTDATTLPGDLTLSSTFRSISVRAAFQGDANANNAAMVEYRQSGGATWYAAYPPIVDRRAMLANESTNPYRNEARGSIVGLAPDTVYEVRVTWLDPDGATSQTPSAVVRTLSYDPPRGGRVISVTGDDALTSALTSAKPGDTIVLKAGAYSPFSLTASGTASAYIAITAEAGTTILGTGDQNVLVTASYVLLDGLTLAPSDHTGFQVAGAAHHVFIKNSIVQDVSRLCGADPKGTYNDAGVLVRGGASHIFILGNTIYGTTLSSAACTLSPTWDSPGAGIYRMGTSGGTFVFEGNTITGGFRDGIGGEGAGAGVDNYDVDRNTVSGTKDDGIEMDGDNMNTRIWENVVTDAGGNSDLSNAPSVVGPVYVFRNVFLNNSFRPGVAIKLGGADAYAFYFHNSIDSTTNAALADYDSGYTTNHTFLNNVIVFHPDAIENFSSRNTLDYNLYWQQTSEFVFHWNDGSSAKNYDTLAAFQAETGQEAHGMHADPAFLDDALNLSTSNPTSPAIDRGKVLVNFNDPSSAWPYAGALPDLGARETR